MKALLYSVVFLIIALGIPRILRLWNGNGGRKTAMDRARAQIVFQGLHMHLKPLLASKNQTPLRVAIGYNSNVDLILDALALMNQFAEQHAVTNVKPHDHISIGNFTQLFESFVEYFKTGSAVERFIADKQVFDAIVEQGGALNTSHYHIGGNAALMGLFLHQQAWHVLLAGMKQKLFILIRCYWSQTARITGTTSRQVQTSHSICEFITTWQR